MASHSTHVSPCNHRMLEVAVIFLAALVVGLIAGIALSLFGMAPLSALCAGAGTFAGAFGTGMSALKYVRQAG